MNQKQYNRQFDTDYSDEINQKMNDNLYNIPKYMINAGNSVYNNIKDSVNISKGGYRKNKKTRNKKTRKKRIRKNNR